MKAQTVANRYPSVVDSAVRRPLASVVESPGPVYVTGVGLGIGCGILILALSFGLLGI